MDCTSNSGKVFVAVDIVAKMEDGKPVPEGSILAQIPGKTVKLEISLTVPKEDGMVVFEMMKEKINEMLTEGLSGTCIPCEESEVEHKQLKSYKEADGGKKTS